jgi:hypothetical protein
MNELIIACVRTGTGHEFGRVTDLRNAVAQHMPRAYTMVCLTDQPERCTGVAFVDISAMGLHDCWSKMALFEPAWRGTSKVIYFGFDMVIAGDISPLADVPGEFAILRNNEKRSPCRYDSSVMVIGGSMGGFVWHAFDRVRDLLQTRHARRGDQACIEELYPDAQILHRVVPKDFFVTHVTRGEGPCHKDRSQAPLFSRSMATSTR